VRPLIGISCGREQKDSFGLRIFYVKAVNEAGGDVLLLPEQGADAAGMLRVLDGLLLSGGGDIHPRLWGSNTACSVADYRRDEWEAALARTALARHLPLLAVCRGLQILNVALGGTLHTDIGAGHYQAAPPEAVCHQVSIAGRWLPKLTGEEQMTVNSLHHQAVCNIAPVLTAAAWSQDGCLEALEGTNGGFMLGVQWHPERLYEHYAPQRALFALFVAQCAIFAARQM